jgi:hypothetical protein
MYLAFMVIDSYNIPSNHGLLALCTSDRPHWHAFRLERFNLFQHRPFYLTPVRMCTHTASSSALEGILYFLNLVF